MRFTRTGNDSAMPGDAPPAADAAAGQPAYGAAGFGPPPARLHLYDRIGVVFKYWKAALSIAIVVGSVVLYKAYTTVPLYRAQARIVIEEEYSAQTDFKEPYLAYQDPEPYYQTQYRILQGRELASRAVKRLHLPQEREFNGQGAAPTNLSQAIGNLKQSILEPMGLATAAPPAIAAMPDEASLVGAFQGRIQVSPVRGSRLVDVLFTAADPELAAKAVNALAEEYVQQNLEFRLQNTRSQLEFLTTEVVRQESVVHKREQDLAAYRQDQNALSLEDNQNIVVSRLNQINDALTRARTARIQHETIFKQVTAPGVDPESLTPIVSNQAVVTLRQRLAERRDQRARLLERYGPKMSQVIDINEQLAQLEQQLASEMVKAIETVKADYQTALDTERRLAGELATERAAVEDLDRKGVNYSVLARQAESDREVYQALLTREKELQVVANSRSNNVRVLDRAQVPAAPFSPDTKRAWMIALLLGLGCGVAAAFAIDYLNDTVRTPDDIRWRLKVDFLGLVPATRGVGRPLLSNVAPPVGFGEAFRALRTALTIRTGGQGTRIVTMTSAQPLEGKTTTAVNTALALARGEARVLLIDADMRRPSVHKALGIQNEKGLADFLKGTATMSEVVRTTGDPNLRIITAGNLPDNPSELLSSQRMRALLERLEGAPLDWVIIDTPPVLAVTDSVILAPLVSAVTFVVGADMTRWRVAERAIETLQSGRARSIGCVLNKVDFTRDRYYYSRHYGNYYYDTNGYSEVAAAS